MNNMNHFDGRTNMTVRRRRVVSPNPERKTLSDATNPPPAPSIQVDESLGTERQDSDVSLGRMLSNSVSTPKPPPNIGMLSIFNLFLYNPNPQARMVDVAILDYKFRQVTAYVFLAWAFLTCTTLIVFSYRDQTKMEEQLPMAKACEQIVAFMMFFSLMTRISPIALGERGQWRRFSGVLVLALTVQFIAAVSNVLMGVIPHPPILKDPFTGCKVHLLRWCEWIPLCFAMAYLTDGIDAWDTRLPFYYAAAQSVSCFAGFLLPFCTNGWVWATVMVVSCVLYITIYMRLFYKWQRLYSCQVGDSVEDIEKYERVSVGARLIMLCSITWSILVGNYFVGWAANAYLGWGPEVSFIMECAIDLLAKHFYLGIVIEAHERVFDDKSRTERRLEELRRMMSVIWSTTTDVLIISTCGIHGTVKTQLSPSFARLLGSKHRFHTDAFVIEQSSCDFIASNNADKKPQTIDSFTNACMTDPAQMQEISGVKHLINKVWGMGRQERLVTCDLRRLDNSLVHCEAKVSRLNDRSQVIVLRDITERYRRFEAEKKVVSQITARRKDAEANRFTRHEVKNGLLAAIGLCDGLREIAAFGESSKKFSPSTSSDSLIPANTLTPVQEETPLLTGDITVNYNNYVERIDELDTTLNQTLDIVVTEVMARDVINGVYEPRLETVDLRNFFSSTRKEFRGNDSISTVVQKLKEDRFPVELVPSNFPMLQLDPQLLRYIHRNAITNAAKYGEKGGVIQTLVNYDFHKEMLEMKVTNRPGPRHEEVLLMGSRAKEIVFSPGKSFHSTKSRGASAGDGAWIMRNCAHALGGNCDIEFLKSGTVFSFYCPVKIESQEKTLTTSLSMPTKCIFPLPPKTWGIGIDDSVVQRKLLKKYLDMVGIPSTHIHVKGNTVHEINGFDDFVVNLISNNPTDLFLIIADENMDVNVDGKHATVSGSLALQSIISRIGPTLERNVLALVRSANDSNADIALYQSRAHGFIPKVPLKKEKAQEMLAPLWIERFGYNRDDETLSHTSSGTNISELDVDIKSDLSRSLDRIDCLFESCGTNNEENNWELVKELLHALKGDLLTYSTNELCRDAMDIIEMIRGTAVFDDYVLYQWKKLYSLVLEILQSMQ